MAEIPISRVVESQLEEKLPRSEPVQGATTEERWAIDPENARNWSAKRKAFVTAVVSLIGFVCTMASPIYSPGSSQVASEFHVSTIVSLLPISLYNVGMAFGPVIASPLSETYGRRAVYLVVCPIFALFVLGSGFASTIASLCICRFFAGTFASPSVAIASATIADMFAPGERAFPLTVYYTTPWLGSLTGPLIGSFVAEHKSWRWTQWTTLFFAVAIFPLILLVRESYKKTILQRRYRRSITKTEPASLRTLSPLAPFRRAALFIRTTLLRPLHMLFTEPIVALLCLYMGFQFGLLYCFVVASPYVFQTVYDFNPGAQGLSFLGFITGCLIGSAFLMLVHRTIYMPRLTRFLASQQHDSKAEFPPEERLYAAQIGSLALPTGLFIFGWTARADIHWICPVVAQGIVMFGSITVYVPAGMYMMDTYGALYGASANGANSLLRYSLAAAFPLFTLRMFEGLGVAWACSLLGFLTLGMAPIPWVFGRWGPGLRGASRYQRGD